MNWILIQQIVVSIMAVVVILSGIIGLIRVVPEINKIVENEKNTHDGSREQKGDVRY